MKIKFRYTNCTVHNSYSKRRELVFKCILMTNGRINLMNNTNIKLYNNSLILIVFFCSSLQPAVLRFAR